MTEWFEWDDEVKTAAERAARDVARNYAVEFDDLHQEALIYIATHRDTVRGRIDRGGVRYAQWGIYSHLTDLAEREHRQRGGREPVSFKDEYAGVAPW